MAVPMNGSNVIFETDPAERIEKKTTGLTAPFTMFTMQEI
jgi:hypothetical protein